MISRGSLENKCLLRGIMSGNLVRTALYEAHQRWGGNIVDFHGFELPIWYTSMMEEHINTRENAGLFDVSHMGFFRFSGNGVREWLQSIATQRVEHLGSGRCAYTHFLDDNGLIIDDMIFAVADSQTISDTKMRDCPNISELVILGVPNASMISVMKTWFDSHLPSDGSIILDDLSQETSILALQGPKSPSIIEAVLGVENVVKHFRGKAISSNNYGITGWIQGTGYTGESKPVKWVRIHNLPDFAYFNHSQHVSVAGVECQTCHGPVETMDKIILTSRAIDGSTQHDKWEMGLCLNCHKQHEVENGTDCWTCHK